MASLEQLQLLINLAKVDGEVSPQEKQMILNVGQANHMLVSEILPLFSGDHRVVVKGPLSNEEKFDYLIALVQLMKIDEKIYRDEIKYCATVASALGYNPEVLVELMLKVRSTPMSKDELDELRRSTESFRA